MISSSMAKPLQTNPGNSWFLGCFPFSMKRKSQNKKTRSVSWPRFRLSSRNSKPDRRRPSADQVARETPKEVKKVISVRFYSWISLFRTRAPTRTGSSLPGSPMIKIKPRKTPTRLSRTVSLPVLEGSQRVGNPRIHAPISSNDLRPKSDDSIAKFEPMMGISIIMVTLITMVLWGRLCAILCTSAWLYACPRFRTGSNNNVSTLNPNPNSDDLYLNSKEYKKKVVLEGLLQRNHRFTL